MTSTVQTLSDAELRAWLRLMLTSGMGHTTARKLLTQLGPPEAIFAHSQAQWLGVVNEGMAQRLAQVPDDLEAHYARTQDWLAASADRALITLGDARYPEALLETADPPLWLFAQGQQQALMSRRVLAVVGSRNPSPQGRENAKQFAHHLAQAQATVASGLALGVDGAAHEGALDGGGLTIAVVGTGLDRVYPKAHHALAHQIAARGILLSEYPLGTPPLAANFPKRNRIISGLAQGTLVVEATLKSGSLITARLASEQGREVFAIPGSIHAPQSKGCHALIKQGAKLVESAQDILEELRWPATEPAPSHQQRNTPNATAEVGTEALEAHPLLAAMGHEAVGLDALQARTGQSSAELQAQLLTLELAGQVSRLPGAQFQRLISG